MAYFIAFLKQLNWIDILALIIFVRILFISLKNGIAAEILKVLGAVFATYVSLHYYRSIGSYFSNRFTLDTAAVECFVFALIACLTYSFFSILRLLLKRFINMEVVPVLSRWGGFILGILRAFLITSLLLYFFLATANPYLRKSMRSSYSGMGLVYVAPSAYNFIWHAAMSKLASREKFNNAVFEIQHDKPTKKK
jgi:uncharacterized membrane protein required for colicin V production